MVLLSQSSWSILKNGSWKSIAKYGIINRYYNNGGTNIFTKNTNPKVIDYILRHHDRKMFFVGSLGIASAVVTRIFIKQALSELKELYHARIGL